MSRFVAIITFAYVAAAVALTVGVRLLADRLWPFTLLAFGPRWPFALPVVPLLLLIFLVPRPRAAALLAALLCGSGLMLWGFMDARLGLGRAPGAPTLRIMTHNAGASHITPDALNRLLRDERIDIAALQECGLYGDDMARLGWHFSNHNHLCLITHYPVPVTDVRDPMDVWKRGGSGGIDRYEIDTPLGRVNLVNVHLETIRDGLEALRARKWRGLAELAANRTECALESRMARDWCTRGSGSLLVTGDFNMPIESAIYRDDWGDLGNAFSSCGRGFGHTKFTRWFGIRIDHVLMSDAWRCVDARVVASPYGGDHWPLVVELGRR